MKQINLIFFFSQTEYWFDGQGENYKSFEIFEDGRISIYDYEDERIPSEIEKEWLANEKLTETIKQIVERITVALEDYNFNSSEFEEYETGDCAEALKKDGNLIEEFYRFDCFKKGIGINFCYRCNNISSEYYKKKAPFTLLVKQIQEKIKLEYPEFEMINVQ